MAFAQHYSGPVEFPPSFHYDELPTANEAPPMFSSSQPRHSIDEGTTPMNFGNYEASPFFQPPSQLPQHGYYPIDQDDDDHYSPRSAYSPDDSPLGTPISSPLSPPTTVSGSRNSSPNLPKRYPWLSDSKPSLSDHQHRLLGIVKPLTPPLASAASRTSSTTPSASQKPFCTHRDCIDPSSGKPLKHFSRKADVGRHYRSQHERRYMDCPKKRCTRRGENGFTRSDHLKEHLRQYHQMPIPKRNCGSALKRLRGAGAVRRCLPATGVV